MDYFQIRLKSTAAQVNTCLIGSVRFISNILTALRKASTKKSQTRKCLKMDVKSSLCHAHTAQSRLALCILSRHFDYHLDKHCWRGMVWTILFLYKLQCCLLGIVLCLNYYSVEKCSPSLTMTCFWLAI